MRQQGSLQRVGRAPRLGLILLPLQVLEPANPGESHVFRRYRLLFRRYRLFPFRDRARPFLNLVQPEAAVSRVGADLLPEGRRDRRTGFFIVHSRSSASISQWCGYRSSRSRSGDPLDALRDANCRPAEDCLRYRGRTSWLLAMPLRRRAGRRRRHPDTVACPLNVEEIPWH